MFGRASESERLHQGLEAVRTRRALVGDCRNLLRFAWISVCVSHQLGSQKADPSLRKLPHLSAASPHDTSMNQNLMGPPLWPEPSEVPAVKTKKHGV